MICQHSEGVADIFEAIRYYEKYNKLRNNSLDDRNCPNQVRRFFQVMGPIKMPKYYEWAKKYMVKKDG